MSELMQQLHHDHGNVVRLLELLERKLGGIGTAGQRDLRLMRDVMQYMTHYPDRHHHPTEDLVFEYLAARDGGARALVQSLLDEHATLAESGSELLQMLRRVLDGELVPRDALQSAGRRYAGLLREHMDREEAEAFPRARRALSESDWEEIERRKESMDDPLFGPVVDEYYQGLYHAVTGGAA